MMSSSIKQEEESTSRLQDKILAYLNVEDLNNFVLIKTNQTDNKNKVKTTIQFSSLYDFKRVIGSGGYGVVFEVKCKLT